MHAFLQSLKLNGAYAAALLAIILAFASPSYAGTIDFVSAGSTTAFGGTPNGASAPITIFGTDANTKTTTFNGAVTSVGIISAPAGISIGNSNISSSGNAAFAGNVSGVSISANGSIAGGSITDSGLTASGCKVGDTVTVGAGGLLTCVANTAPVAGATPLYLAGYTYNNFRGCRS